MPKKGSKMRNVTEEKPRESTVEFLSSLAAVLATGLFIIAFCFEAFAIPSSSMENTLLVGDHVFVDRVQFAPKDSLLGSLLPYRGIRRGDIVVFLSPQTRGSYVVKRIIGIPGDRIHLSDGIVYRNGEKLDEPYVLHDADNRIDFYRNNFPTVKPSDFDDLFKVWETELPLHIQGEDIVVPPNAYFGMGDHRGVSYDSRYWGFIPQQNVIGRPMFIYWSFETPDGEYLKTSLGDRAAILTHAIIHFFDETRWSRTLRQVR